MTSNAGCAEIWMDFLSSAHIFAVAVRRVFEEEILHEIAGGSLTFSQLKLLFLESRAEGHTIGDAAAFLGVSNAAASKSVEKLVRRKMLARAEVLQDRRSSQLCLTEESRRLLHAYDAARQRKAAVAFRQIDLEELQKTAEVLDRLSAIIVRHSAEPAEICLQCEVFYRDNCRFGELSGRKCFYQTHKSDEQARLAHPEERR